jgi:hypothetical protein
MRSEQREEMLHDQRKSAGLTCSHRSSEVLLVFLILICLHVVAVYDWLVSSVLRAGRKFNRATSFDTTHISRSFARRVRPLD